MCACCIQGKPQEVYPSSRTFTTPACKHSSSTVVVLFERRNYGFVAPDDDGNNLFIHVTGLTGVERPCIGNRLCFAWLSEWLLPSARNKLHSSTRERKSTAWELPSMHLPHVLNIIATLGSYRCWTRAVRQYSWRVPSTKEVFRLP